MQHASYDADPSAPAPDTLPSGGELAWISEQLSAALSALIDLEEYLAGAFNATARVFEPLTLDGLARLLLLADDARTTASEAAERAESIERQAFGLFREQEGPGVVTSPAGIERHIDYRRRNADMYRVAAEAAAEAAREAEDAGKDT